MLKVMADEIGQVFAGVQQYEGEADAHWVKDMFALAAAQGLN